MSMDVMGLKKEELIEPIRFRVFLISDAISVAACFIKRNSV